MLSLSFLITLEGRAWYLNVLSEHEISSKWKDYNSLHINFDYISANDLSYSVNEIHEQEKTMQDSQFNDEIDEFITAAQEKLLPQ